MGKWSVCEHGIRPSNCGPCAAKRKEKKVIRICRCGTQLLSHKHLCTRCREIATKWSSTKWYLKDRLVKRGMCSCGTPLMFGRRLCADCKIIAFQKARLRNVYRNMVRRCTNPNDSNYRHYGKRGITVCDEWLTDFNVFESFALANGYNDTLTIDRIDNDKGYYPTNVQFIPWLDNCRKNRMAVTQYDLGGNQVASYSSLCEAGRSTSVAIGSIYRVCRGERGTAGGYFGNFYRFA